MDYKKKYEEALNSATDLWESGNDLTREQMELVFPELKESEDERIRKEIEKDAKEWYKENYEGENPQGRSVVIGAYIDGALAWLEKQKDLPIVYDKETYRDALQKSRSCFVEDESNKAAHDKGFQNGYQFGIHEEKPLIWTKHDEAVRKEAISCLEDWGKKYGIIGPDYLNILAWLKDELVIHTQKQKERPVEKDWLKDYEERVDAEIGSSYYTEKDCNKPAECISDAEMKQSMDAVHDFKVFAADLAKTFNITYKRDIDWHNFCAGLLTYLERNKPAEWSEDDNLMASSIIDTLKLFEHRGATDMKIDWLENRLQLLRPQHHWKPSEKQMNKLNVAIRCYENEWGEDAAKSLDDLYEELKKL